MPAVPCYRSAAAILRCIRVNLKPVPLPVRASQVRWCRARPQVWRGNDDSGRLAVFQAVNWFQPRWFRRGRHRKNCSLRASILCAMACRKAEHLTEILLGKKTAPAGKHFRMYAPRPRRGRTPQFPRVTRVASRPLRAGDFVKLHQLPGRFHAGVDTSPRDRADREGWGNRGATLAAETGGTGAGNQEGSGIDAAKIQDGPHAGPIGRAKRPAARPRPATEVRRPPSAAARGTDTGGRPRKEPHRPRQAHRRKRSRRRRRAPPRRRADPARRWAR